MVGYSFAFHVRDISVCLVLLNYRKIYVQPFVSEIVGAVLYSDSKAEAKNTEDLANLNYRLKIG